MKTCQACGVQFGDENTRKLQIHCSKKCAANASHRRRKGLTLRLNVLKCIVCDKVFRQKRTNNTEYCDFRCKKLAASRRFKGLPIHGPKKHIHGSGYITANGYKMLTKNHPNASKRKQILEHVFVMSNHLGRPLYKKETVHHKNGIRDDNRIENLELWSNSHPFGQRVEDKIKWCKEFLAQYGFEVIIKNKDDTLN